MHPKNRVLYLDYVKGFAIILVVIGHTIGGLVPLGIIHRPSIYTGVSDFIYTFHMPLFFFVSGFLSTKLLYQPAADFARKTLLTIVAPYLIWSWIFLLISNGLQGNVNNHYAAWNFPGILLPWYSVSVYWFLYALLCAKLAYFAARTKGSSGVTIVFYAFAFVYLIYELFLIRLPLPAPLLLTIGQISKAGTFVGFGLIAATQRTVMDTILSPKYIFPLAVGWMAGAALVVYSEAFSAFRFLTGFLGTALTLTLAHQIEAGGYRPQFLATAGKATLPIFVTHVIFAAAMRTILLKMGLSAAFLHLVLETAAGVTLPMILYYAANRWRIAPYAGFGANTPLGFAGVGGAPNR